MNAGAPEGLAVPSPLVTSVMLLLIGSSTQSCSGSLFYARKNQLLIPQTYRSLYKIEIFPTAMYNILTNITMSTTFHYQTIKLFLSSNLITCHPSIIL